jgi:hypothetical protein
MDEEATEDPKEETRPMKRISSGTTLRRRRAMFDRYSIASTKDIEAALRKATLPVGNSVGQRETR